MFLRDLSKREKIIMFVTAALIVAALTYNLAIEPLVERWRTLDAQIAAKVTVLMKNKLLLQKYKSLESEYTKYPALLDEGISEGGDLAITLREIENISKKSSCHIANVKPQTSKKLGKYKEISFDLSVEGGIEEITRFLYEVETSKNCLRVRRFSITPKSGDPTKLKGTLLVSKLSVL